MISSNHAENWPVPRMPRKMSPPIATTTGSGLPVPQDPHAHDREAVAEVVADRDGGVQRGAAAPAARRVARRRRPDAAEPEDAERIEDREHGQQARAHEQDPEAAADLRGRAHDPAEQRVQAREPPQHDRREDVGARGDLVPHEHPAERPDRRQHAQDDDRAVELREPHAQLLALRGAHDDAGEHRGHEPELDRLARAEERDQRAAVDAAHERLRREEDVRGPHGMTGDVDEPPAHRTTRIGIIATSSTGFMRRPHRSACARRGAGASRGPPVRSTSSARRGTPRGRSPTPTPTPMIAPMCEWPQRWFWTQRPRTAPGPMVIERDADVARECLHATAPTRACRGAPRDR